MGVSKNNNLTQRDLEVAAFVWQCFKSEPTINYTKLADIAGFKNAASANACWSATKKKLLAQGKAGGQPTSATGSPATPKTAMRKRKNPMDTKSVEETPSKKGKNTVIATPDDDDDEHGDILVVKKEEVKGETDDGSDDQSIAAGVDRKDSFFAT